MIQTNFEADTYISTLSKQLDCPVLSNDSDFFLQEVEFVPLDSILFGKQGEAEDAAAEGINARRFNQSLFRKKYRIDKGDEFLYLLSTLLGNDYVPGGTFERFFAQIKIPKKKSLSYKHKQTVGLLQWLANEGTVDGAIEKVMDTIPKAERAKILAKIKLSMQMYAEEEAGTSKSEISNEVPSFGGGPPIPTWFLDEFRDGLHLDWIMNILCNRFSALPAQVESQEAESSHLFALPLLSLSCNLALSMVDQDRDEEIKIGIHVRCRKRGQVHTLSYEKPVLTLPALRKLPLLERRKAFNSSVLGLVSSKEDLVSQSSLARVFPWLETFLWGVYLWTRLESSGVPESTMKVLSVGVLIYVLDRDECPSSLGQRGEPFDTVTETEAVTFREDFINEYKKTNTNIKARTAIANEFVCQIANLQCLIYHLIVLQKLVLGSEVPVPRIADMWQGTLLFNLSNDVQEYQDVEARIKMRLSKIGSGKFYDCYRFVNACLVSCSGKLSSQSQGGKRIRNRKGKRGNMEKASGAVENSDVTNRFELLQIE